MIHWKKWLHRVETAQEEGVAEEAQTKFRIHKELMALMVRRPY